MSDDVGVLHEIWIWKYGKECRVFGHPYPGVYRWIAKGAEDDRFRTTVSGRTWWPTRSGLEKDIFFLEDRTLRCLSVGHACAKSLKADRDDSYAKSKHLHARLYSSVYWGVGSKQIILKINCFKSWFEKIEKTLCIAEKYLEENSPEVSLRKRTGRTNLPIFIKLMLQKNFGMWVRLLEFIKYFFPRWSIELIVVKAES